MERVIRISSVLLLSLALLLAAGMVFSSDPAESLSPAATTTPRRGGSLPLESVDTPPSQAIPNLPTADLPANPDTLVQLNTLDFVHPKSGRYVAAWMPTDWDTDNARASFDGNADLIDEISPVWYVMRSNGTLHALGGSRDRSLVETAHAAGTLVIPSITNGFDPGRTGYVLLNLERRSQFVQRILEEVDEYGYDGIDVDFEAVPSRERDAFTAFMRELALGLHARGHLLTVAIHARTSDSGGAAGAQAQDWYALGQIVDRFRIMTYDYHWRGGGPGPVAPIYWVEDVVEYALSQVDPSRIVVGVPFYGYDWVNGEGRSVTWQEIQRLIEQYEPDVEFREWDENGEVAETWFTYRTREGLHTVWFASQRSLEAKLELVIEYDLAGIAIWRLGGEDPAYWQVVRDVLPRDPYEVLRAVLRYLPDP